MTAAEQRRRAEGFCGKQMLNDRRRRSGRWCALPPHRTGSHTSQFVIARLERSAR